MKVRYIVEVETNAPEDRLHRVDMALAKEIHHAFPLCPTQANPVQRAHLWRMTPGAPRLQRGGAMSEGSGPLIEILYDPVRADREEPPDYVSPVGAPEDE